MHVACLSRCPRQLMPEDAAFCIRDGLRQPANAWCRAQQYPGLFITPETLTPKAVEVPDFFLSSRFGCQTMGAASCRQHVSPQAPLRSCAQVLGTDLPIYVATDHANRTFLEPLIKAFPKVRARYTR